MSDNIKCILKKPDGDLYIRTHLEDLDVVLECTGFFTSKEKAEAHIKAGAKKVVI